MKVVVVMMIMMIMMMMIMMNNVRIFSDKRQKLALQGQMYATAATATGAMKIWEANNDKLCR